MYIGIQCSAIEMVVVCRLGLTKDYIYTYR